MQLNLIIKTITVKRDLCNVITILLLGFAFIYTIISKTLVKRIHIMEKTDNSLISMVVYQEKGGVGKSTISSWLAYLLATGGLDGKSKKLRVLLVDLDSQQNLSKSFLQLEKRTGVPYHLPPRHPDFIDGNPENGTWNGYSTSSDILFNREFCYYDVKGVDNLKILPSEGRVDRLKDVIGDNGFIPLVSELANEFISQEREMGDVDIIIFDTPPSKTTLCEGFLSVASHVLIPTQLEYDSVEAIPNLIENINIYNEQREKPIEIVGFIPNLVSSTAMTNSEVEQYQTLFSYVKKYEQDNDKHNLLPADFYMVNRVAFKPRRKPDDLDKVFSLKKDKKARREMTMLYEFVHDKLGIAI